MGASGKPVPRTRRDAAGDDAVAVARPACFPRPPRYGGAFVPVQEVAGERDALECSGRFSPSLFGLLANCLLNMWSLNGDMTAVWLGDAALRGNAR